MNRGTISHRSPSDTENTRDGIRSRRICGFFIRRNHNVVQTSDPRPVAAAATQVSPCHPFYRRTKRIPASHQIRHRFHYLCTTPLYLSTLYGACVPSNKCYPHVPRVSTIRSNGKKGLIIASQKPIRGITPRLALFVLIQSDNSAIANNSYHNIPSRHTQTGIIRRKVAAKRRTMEGACGACAPIG